MGSKPSTNTSVAVGQALCGLVHDISNIVQTVLLRAEVTMVTEELSGEVCGALEKIITDSKKSVDVLRYLLEHSRAQVAMLPPVDVGKAIEDIVTELADTAALRGALEFHGSKTALVTHADEAQLKELVVILVEEMFRDADSSTRLTITLGNTSATAADTTGHWMAEMDGIRLTLVRDGVGAPLEIEDGMLGLPTSPDEPPEVLQLLRVKGIIRQHRGQFRVVESVGDSVRQLTLEISLPFQGD